MTRNLNSNVQEEFSQDPRNQLSIYASLISPPAEIRITFNTSQEPK